MITLTFRENSKKDIDRHFFGLLKEVFQDKNPEAVKSDCFEVLIQISSVPDPVNTNILKRQKHIEVSLLEVYGQENISVQRLWTLFTLDEKGSVQKAFEKVSKNRHEERLSLLIEIVSNYITLFGI